MRLTRVRVLLAVSGLIASGAVAGTVLAAAAPASAGPAAVSAPASTRFVLVNQCTGKGQVRPSTMPLPDCMTSSELIGHAKWTSWGSAAFGRGDLEVNNCDPSSKCGPSMYTKYPILMVLWRARPWAGQKGDDYFSRVTWIFTGKRPAHTPVSQTITWLSSAQ